MLTYSRSPSLHLSSDFSIFTFFYFVRLHLLYSVSGRWFCRLLCELCWHTKTLLRYSICSADMRSPPTYRCLLFFPFARSFFCAIAPTISIVRFALSVLCMCMYVWSILFFSTLHKFRNWFWHFDDICFSRTCSFILSMLLFYKDA